MRYISVLAGALLLSFVHAQTSDLHGVVVVQNSTYRTGKRTHVSGAGVRAPFAKATSSDATGRFHLRFQGVAPGVAVQMLVEKTGMVVVNTADIEAVIVGRAPDLTVVMADEKELMASREKFHGLAVASITASYEQRVQAISDEHVQLEQRLAVLSQEMGQELNDLSSAHELLEQRRDQAMAHAQDLADQLARVDLDDASTAYRIAYAHFDAGRIDSAIATLDPERLAGTYTDAMAQRDRGTALIAHANRSIKQVYHSYDLRANVLRTQLRFKECFDLSNTILDMARAEQDVLGPLEEASVLVGRNLLLKDMGEYEQARVAVSQALQIHQRVLGGSHPKVIDDYLILANNAMDLGRSEEALIYVDTSAHLLAQLPDGSAADLRQRVHLTRASALTYLGEMQTAIAECHRAISADTAWEFSAGAHDNLGVLFYELGELDSAWVHIKEARRIEDPHLVANDPARVSGLIYLGALRGEQGHWDSALVYYDRAVTLLTQIHGPGHPQLAHLENNRSTALRMLQRNSEAREAIRHGLEIGEITGSRVPFTIGSLHFNLAWIHTSEKDLDSAAIVYGEVLRIWEPAFGRVHPAVADAYLFRGRVLEQAARFDEALADYLREDSIRQVVDSAGLSGRTSSADMGRCLYSMGRKEEAKQVLERSVERSPTSEAFWYLYRIAADTHRPDEAMDRLIAGWRASLDEPALLPERQQEIREHLRDLATERKRLDIIEELDKQ